MNSKNEVFEYLIDQLRQQVTNNQCEDLEHEVQSLKNQLRDASAQIKELHKALATATGDVEVYKILCKGEHGLEQSGCRKEDAQECRHEFVHRKHKSCLVCFKCGAHKECGHEWQFYGVGFPCMCLKCGLKK